MNKRIKLEPSNKKNQKSTMMLLMEEGRLIPGAQRYA
jgi:hypothetical protein